MSTSTTNETLQACNSTVQYSTGCKVWTEAQSGSAVNRAITSTSYWAVILTHFCTHRRVCCLIFLSIHVSNGGLLSYYQSNSANHFQIRGLAYLTLTPRSLHSRAAPAVLRPRARSCATRHAADSSPRSFAARVIRRAHRAQSWAPGRR